MNKKAIAAIAVMGISFLGYMVGVFAPQKEGRPVSKVNDYVYTQVSDGYKVAKGSSFISRSELYLPAEYDGQPVTEIAANGFENADLRVVYVPPSVKRIGQYAFKDNPLLVYIEIPSSVITVGQRLFEGNIHNATYVRIGGQHAGTRWYATSDAWRYTGTGTDQVANVWYEVGYKLEYDKPEYHEISINTVTYDKGGNEVSAIGVGTRVKQILTYGDEHLEIKLENDSVTWVPYNTVSLRNNQHAFVHKQIYASMTYLNPFDTQSATLSNYNNDYRSIDANLHKLIRIIAMDYRLERDIMDYDIFHKINYYLVEVESGEVGWVRTEHILHERFKPALAIGFIFHPLRNFFVLGESGVFTLIAFLLFYYAPLIAFGLGIRSLGNALSEKINGNKLFKIMLIGITVFQIILFPSLVSAYYSFNSFMGILFAFGGLGFTTLMYWAVACGIPNRRLCPSCNMWDGVIQNQIITKKWNETTTTTTTTTYTDGSQKVDRDWKTEKKQETMYDCECPHCGETWNFTEVGSR